MIIEYSDSDLEDLIVRGNSGNRFYRILSRNDKFMRDLMSVITILINVENTKGLRQYGKLHYEGLRYNMSGMSSVRIGYSSPYRLVFTELENGIRISLIEINNHYGDK